MTHIHEYSVQTTYLNGMSRGKMSFKKYEIQYYAANDNSVHVLKSGDKVL